MAAKFVETGYKPKTKIIKLFDETITTKRLPGWADIGAIMQAMQEEFNNQKEARDIRLFTEANQLIKDKEFANPKFVGGKMSYRVAYLLNNRNLAEEHDTASYVAKKNRSEKYHKFNNNPEDKYHTRRRTGNRRITSDIRSKLDSSWTQIPTKRLDVCLSYGKDDAIFEFETKDNDLNMIAEERLYHLSVGLETDTVNIWIFNHDSDKPELQVAAITAAKKIFENVIVHLELADVFKNVNLQLKL